ncbi:protein croquemort-like [Lucilia sericata]|uniref:protein croquemort-like n=1 Tax=Lucilia sericata TaxID=13632 RepID=UPI0018A845D1|nr:protein croquemort-like [Lucilia sericata]
MPKRSASKLIIKWIKKYAKYLFIIFAILLAIVGVFCIVFSNIFVNRFINSHLELRPGNKIVDIWTKPDVNITLELYFFNWTNPDDFFNPSVKPKLQEIGPYSFVEIPEKEIFQWHH